MPDGPTARDLASCAKGRIGEYIAAAAIENMGWRVMLAPIEHVDLIAVKGPHTIRVQVKSAFPANEQRRRPRYQFKNGGRFEVCDPVNVDALALVAVDLRIARFTLLPRQRMVTVHPELFTPDEEQSTWRAVCEEITGGNSDR